MTAIDRLNATARLGEAYLILHKLGQLEDYDARMAVQELRNSIEDAEKIIISKQVFDQFKDN